MPRPAARARSTALGLALALGLGACGGDDGSGTGTDETGSTGGDEPVPSPAFSEPVSGKLSLLATRTTDVVLKVTGVVPGRTELVIDGQGLGPLGPEALAGRLTPDILTLHVRGALVAGRHALLMRIVGPEGVAESKTIDVEIERDLSVVPALEPMIPTELGARRLLAVGRGDDALLVVLDDGTGPEPVLHLLPHGADGWDLEGRRTVAVPGLALDPAARVLPAAALRLHRTDDDPGRVRVAWRVGAPGERIDVLEVAWDDATAEVAPLASLALHDALAGHAAEWAELGRPWLLADVLLAELVAPVDAEAPRPGDRALVWTRLRPDPATPTGLVLDAPQRAAVRTERVDLDRLGPALDRVSDDLHGPPTVTIRADQHQPLVLEHDPAGGVRVRPTVVDGRDRSFSHADLPLATVVGAFGARTVAGVTARASGRMRVTTIDDLGDGGVDEASLGTDDLPALEQVTAELAVSVVGGLPVFLVPFGAQAPVHAVYSTGSVVRIEVLEGLDCDAVALAPRPDPDGAVALACARDGHLHLGALVPTPAS